MSLPRWEAFYLIFFVRIDRTEQRAASASLLGAVACPALLLSAKDPDVRWLDLILFVPDSVLLVIRYRGKRSIPQNVKEFGVWQSSNAILYCR